MEKPDYARAAPIAALATPPGESALAVIRVSGALSLDLLAGCFSRPGALRAARGNEAVYGWIVDPRGGKRERVDEVMVTAYRAPRSYSGEDAADITCHGGYAAPAAVLRLLLERGFAAALPGEFSYRAFANGKIDLSRAEAVMEIVAARGEAARRDSAARLSGALERDVDAAKDALVSALAAVELGLDYSDIDGIGDEEAGLPDRAALEACAARLEAQAALWQSRRLEREGALVVIAGAPNAGKSSLFNLLLNEERAIVCDAPGTTRDWVEGRLEAGGIPLRLADTAGLRETDDPAEKAGVERARALAAEADLVICLLDGEAISLSGEDGGRVFAAGPRKPGYPLQSAREYADGFPLLSLARGESRRSAPPVSGEGAAPPPAKSAPRLFVWNKCDRAPMPPGFTVDGAPCLELSAKTGAGAGALLPAVASALRAGAAALPPEAAGHAGAGTERQKDLVARAAAAVRETLARAAGGATLDLIAPPLRDAINSLGEITGEVSSARILETMFKTFCVGK